jgi:hypothetical protein
MNDELDKTQTRSGWQIIGKFIWDNWFGLTAAFLIAAYFYFKGVKEPQLTFYVSPTRTAIVQIGKTNNLNNFSVSLNGNKIEGDLSSVEIQIWNEGNAPIHRADILKTISLSTPHNEPIYQITTKPSRDVIDFSINPTNPGTGVIAMDWRILEHNDGVKFQIIYGGNVNLPFSVDGAIEGQPEGIKQFVATKNSIKGSLAEMSSSIGVLICLVALLWQGKRLPKGGDMQGTIKVIWIGLVVSGVGVVLNLFYTVYHLSVLTAKPPFGF